MGERSKTRPVRAGGLTQCFRMQLKLFEFVMRDDSDAKLVPEYVRAWAVLEERKRILQGKALPGEELRASTTGMAMHAMLKRGKSRALPGFAYAKPAQVADVQPSCGPEATTSSGVTEPVTANRPQSAEVPQAQPAVESSH